LFGEDEYSQMEFGMHMQSARMSKITNGGLTRPS